MLKKLNTSWRLEKPNNGDTTQHNASGKSLEYLSYNVVALKFNIRFLCYLSQLYNKRTLPFLALPPLFAPLSYMQKVA